MVLAEVMAEHSIKILREALFTHEKDLFYENRRREMGHDWLERRKKVAVPIPQYMTLTQDAVDIVVLKLAHAGWVSEWIDVNARQSHNSPGFLCWLDPRRLHFLVDQHKIQTENETLCFGTLKELLDVNPISVGARKASIDGYAPTISFGPSRAHDYKALYRWDTDQNLWHMVIPSTRLLP